MTGEGRDPRVALRDVLEDAATKLVEAQEALAFARERAREVDRAFARFHVDEEELDPRLLASRADVPAALELYRGGDRVAGLAALLTGAREALASVTLALSGTSHLSAFALGRAFVDTLLVQALEADQEDAEELLDAHRAGAVGSID